MIVNCGTCKGTGRMSKGKVLCELCGGLGHHLTIDVGGSISPGELSAMKIKADSALLNMFDVTRTALKILGRKR